MQKIFYTLILFLITAACNSGGNANNAADNETTNRVKGNSAGSNVIEMDTLHMDTSGKAMSADDAHH